MAAKLKDVAKRANVAPNTASTILNHRSNNWASKATVERVFAAARELGYRPNKAAVGLRMGKSHTIGLVIPDLQNPYFCKVADLLERTLEKRGYYLIIESARLDPEREQRCIQSLFERRIDGAFLSLMVPGSFASAFESINRPSVPALLLSGVGHAHVDLDTVEIDYGTGLCEAIGHLFGLGHRRFAFLSAISPNQPTDARTRIFREQLAARGMDQSAAQIVHCGPTPDSARHAFAEFLSSLPSREHPTCVLALNDISALGVIRAAAEFGLEIPRDISVVGVDDMPLARFLPKALTTISCDSETLVESAVEALFARMNGAEIPAPSAVCTLPTRLIVRETTAVALSS